MGWGARFAGVVVAGAVLSVGGCGAGPEGQALPAATSDSTPDPSPSASRTSASPSPTSHQPTAVPVSAPGHSAKGAEAFVRHWIDIANKAFRTGSVDDWRALNASSCETCKARLHDVEESYGAGGRIDGGELTVVDLLPSPIEDDELVLVVADLKVSAEKRITAADKVTAEFPANDTRLVFYLAWEDDSWLVSRLKVAVG